MKKLGFSLVLMMVLAIACMSGIYAKETKKASTTKATVTTKTSQTKKTTKQSSQAKATTKQTGQSKTSATKQKAKASTTKKTKAKATTAKQKNQVKTSATKQKAKASTTKKNKTKTTTSKQTTQAKTSTTKQKAKTTKAKKTKTKTSKNHIKVPVLNQTNVVEHAHNHVYLQVKNISKKTKVIWSTSDRKMATVDKTGAVWLLKPGNVTVTAKVNNKTLTCQITAKDPILLNKESLYLNIRKKDQLSVSNLFPKETKIVKWRSLNPLVATIDKNGVVTAKSIGTTALRVQIGQCILGCDVTVIKPAKMNVGGKMKMVTGDAAQLRLMNSTFTAESQWSSSDSNIVTVDQQGIVNCINEGQAVITAINSGEVFKTTITVKNPAIKFRAVNSSVQAYIKNASQPAAWTTSDSNIASIDANGVLTGYNPGDLTITGTIGNQKATYKLHVSRVSMNDAITYLFWRQSNKRLVTLNKLTTNQINYFTCDDYSNYSIAFKRYNTERPDELIMQSQWGNYAKILGSGNTYSFMLGRNEDAVDQSAVPLSAADCVRVSRIYTMEHSNVPSSWLKYKTSAHRGDMTKAPENTVDAYKAAGKQKKYISIEADVHDTADGKLVMIHDNNLARMTNIGKKDPNRYKPLCQLTLKQIQSYSIKATVNGKTKVYKNLHIPTFEQYLDICKKYNKVAFIDMKTFNKSGTLQKMINIIRKKHMEKRVMLMCYYFGYLENVTHLPGGYSLKKCALFKGSVYPVDKNIILENGIGVVSVPRGKESKAEANWCKKNGLQYSPY